MKFTCLHCEQHIDADDSLAGENINCPRCDGEFTVPAAASPEFGVCPKCGNALTAPDPVICVNCGHRFRKTPVGPEERARRRVLRLRMLPWLIFGTVGYFVALNATLYATPYVIFIGIVLYAITIGVVPGIIAAAWAKFIMLRADRRTGSLAIGILCLAIFVNLFYSTGNNFTSLKRSEMIRAIVDNPECVNQYPSEPARDEMHRAAVELHEQNLPDKQIWKAQANLRIQLAKKYGEQNFPFHYQVNGVIQDIREHIGQLLFRLFGLSIFNILLAYFFASRAHSFCSIPHLKIAWDADIPGKSDDDELGASANPMFIFAIAVVTINALIIGFVNIVIWAVMGDVSGRSFLMFLVSAVLSIPSIYCFRQCEGRRWILALLVLGITLIFSAIIWRFSL